MHCKEPCKGGICLNIQFKKGALELCVLALLNRKDCYGFELVTKLSSRIGMSEGAVYPLLKRLRDDGKVAAYLVESSEGPPRKYYRITDKGGEDYVKMREQWREFAAQVDMIVNEVDADSGVGEPDGGGGQDSGDDVGHGVEQGGEQGGGQDSGVGEPGDDGEPDGGGNVEKEDSFV